MNPKEFLKYYGDQPNFRLVNPNPTWADKKGIKWDRGDCTIRALANVLSISWVEAFDYLTKKARRDFYVTGDQDAWRKWIPESGGKWIATPALKGKSRMTALEFAKKHPKGRFVLYMSHHVAACVDGVILDAWNCGEKCLVGYYDFEGFDINK